MVRRWNSKLRVGNLACPKVRMEIIFFPHLGGSPSWPARPGLRTSCFSGRIYKRKVLQIRRKTLTLAAAVLRSPPPTR